MVGLPVPKTVLKAQPRPCFTACGEVSTHNQPYSGVAKRSLQTLPRLQPGEKQTMIGENLKDLPAKFVEHASNGHPLFWQEIKTVGLFSQLLTDLGVGHVVDLSPGSGACAVAAAMNHITYDGFCFNDMHKSWLEKVLDRAMLGVFTDKEVPNHDKEFGESIRKYFSASITDATKLIKDIQVNKDDKDGKKSKDKDDSSSDVDSAEDE